MEPVTYRDYSYNFSHNTFHLDHLVVIEALKHGVKHIHIEELDTGIIYKSTMQDWIDNAVTVDDGYTVVVYMPKGLFQR